MITNEGDYSSARPRPRPAAPPPRSAGRFEHGFGWCITSARCWMQNAAVPLKVRVLLYRGMAVRSGHIVSSTRTGMYDTVTRSCLVRLIGYAFPPPSPPQCDGGWASS